MSGFERRDGTGTGAIPFTAREAECLRLLADGGTTRTAASRLGISPSTFAKHLAAARAKLGVHTTREALLLRERRDAPNEADTLAHMVGDASYLADLATDLQACGTFDAAWAVYLRHAARVGAVSVNFGLVAEPPGQVTNGARILGMALPDELLALYAAAGGASKDGMMRKAALDLRPLNLDSEVLSPDLRAAMSRPLRRFSDALLDHGMRYVLGTPMSDPATGAYFATVFMFERQKASDIRRYEARHFRINRGMSATFWASLQERRLLTSFVPLTAREREALLNAARGFPTHESAERMGISQRALEKLLTRARAAFGAPSTPAAIYRAIVYRAAP